MANRQNDDWKRFTQPGAEKPTSPPKKQRDDWKRFTQPGAEKPTAPPGNKSTGALPRKKSSRGKKAPPPKGPLAKAVPYLSAAFLLLIVILFTYLYNTREGMITGIVYDLTDNTSLSKVFVTLDEQAPKENNSLNGAFIFQHIKKGKHTILFKRKGYQSSRLEIELTKAGEKKEIQVYMELKKAVGLSDHSLLVLNYGSNSISVLNPESMQEVTRIRCCSKPSDIKILAEKDRAYVANAGNGSISVIDLVRLKEIKKLKIKDGFVAQKLLLSENTQEIYIFNPIGREIAVLRLADEEISKDIIKLNNPIFDIVIDKGSGNLLALGPNSLDTLSVQGTVMSSLKLGSTGRSLQYNEQEANVLIADGRGLYKLNLFGGDESRFPVNTSGNALTLSPDGSRVFFLGGQGLAVFDIQSSQLMDTSSTGGEGAENLLVSPDGQKLFISNSRSGYVSVYDISQGKLLDNKIPVGSIPKAMAFAEIEEN